MLKTSARRAVAKAKLLSNLIARDGCNCFLCHKPLGYDITVEHLLAKVHGGTSDEANLVLAHRGCNHFLADMPVINKIKAREYESETNYRRATTVHR